MRRFRCRRFRSRELLVVVLFVVVLVVYTPTFFYAPADVDKVNRGNEDDVDNTNHVDNLLSKSVPLTAFLERLDGIQLTDMSLRSTSVDVSGCGIKAVPRPPRTVGSTDHDWQPVSALNKDAYVVSAHVDRRWLPVPLIKIIGLTSKAGGDSLVCRMWYEDDTKPVHTRATQRVVSESHGKRYSASIYSCSVRSEDKLPYAVTLLHDPCDVTTPNLLPVRSAHAPSRRVNFTVCVTPLNYRYNNYNQLVEIIEVNRMFGAQKFIFYNYSTGPFVNKFLDSYDNDGLVSVIPWSVPVTVDVWPPDSNVNPEVHYFAQLAALNDCIYRSLEDSTFVVFTDLDEILVPQRHSDWASMLDEVSRSKGSSNPNDHFPGAYIVRSSFFRTDWPNDEQIPRTAIDRQLLTLLKTRRETKIYDWSQRSKYVIWTKAALVVGVHNVIEYMPKAKGVNVDVDEALINHYRLWFDESHNPPLIDRSMHRFTDEIVARVQAKHAAFEQLL